MSADSGFKPGGKGLVGERRAKDGGDDLMQVGEALNGVGEGLLVDLGVVGCGYGRGSCGR